MQLFLKIFSRMANSADPDQTALSEAVLYGSVLFAYVISSETLVYGILGHLPYIHIFYFLDLGVLLQFPDNFQPRRYGRKDGICRGE